MAEKRCLICEKKLPENQAGKMCSECRTLLKNKGLHRKYWYVSTLGHGITDKSFFEICESENGITKGINILSILEKDMEKLTQSEQEKRKATKRLKELWEILARVQEAEPGKNIKIYDSRKLEDYFFETFDFHGSDPSLWPYRSSLDFAILINESEGFGEKVFASPLGKVLRKLSHKYDFFKYKPTQRGSFYTMPPLRKKENKERNYRRIDDKNKAPKTSFDDRSENVEYEIEKLRSENEMLKAMYKINQLFYKNDISEDAKTFLSQLVDFSRSHWDDFVKEESLLTGSSKGRSS